MACFITPLVAAVLLSLADRRSGKWRSSLRLLTLLMWGGAAALVADHVITGELVPWPPFLTAWNPAEGLLPLLEEITFTGGAITISILGVWGVALLAPRLFSSQTIAKIRSTILKI
ncbi:MAG: hypothetical protein QXO86_05350 [Nitrososphaerota archaeon]